MDQAQSGCRDGSNGCNMVCMEYMCTYLSFTYLNSFRLLNSDANDNFIVIRSSHGKMTFPRSSLKCLEDGKWANDEVVNFGLK